MKKFACCFTAAALVALSCVGLSGCKKIDGSIVVNGAWKMQGNMEAAALQLDTLSDDVYALRAYVDPEANEIELIYQDKFLTDIGTCWKGKFDRKEIKKQVPKEVVDYWNGNTDQAIESGLVTEEIKNDEASSDDEETNVNDDGTVTLESSDPNAEGTDSENAAGGEDSEAAEPTELEVSYAVVFSALSEDEAYLFDEIQFFYDGGNDTLNFELPLSGKSSIQVILERDDFTNYQLANGQDPWAAVTDEQTNRQGFEGGKNVEGADLSWADGNTVYGDVEVLDNNDWDETVNPKKDKKKPKPIEQTDNKNDNDNTGGGDTDNDDPIEIDGIIIDQS